MRVLLSVFACEPNRGSEPGFGWNWAVHLAQLKHEVWALTSLEGKEAIERELALAPIPNLKFIYVESPKWIDRYIKGQIGYFSQYLGWQNEAYKVARQIDREYKFDVVHHATLSSITGGSVLWRLNKPFIFGSVGGGQVAPPAFKEYFGDRWNRETLRSLTNQLILLNPNTRKNVSRADLVLVTNQDTFAMAKRLGARRVEYSLDTGLETQYLPPELPIRSRSPELRLLWVGTVQARKALPLALECLRLVSPEISVKMTVLGGGFLSDRVPGWIRKNGLEERVDYRGQVSWQEVKNQYLKSDVFIFTSLRDSFGSQLLEAMACGLPIITLNHQGARDFVPEGCSIKVPVVDPKETINALARAVEYLYGHPEKRLEMGRIGYEFALNQTWLKKALKISEYYEEIVSKKY